MALLRLRLVWPTNIALSGSHVAGKSRHVSFTAYNAATTEKAWQSRWFDENEAQALAQKSDGANGRPDFMMILPPPNVTGVLHCGHALTVALQDAIVRYNEQEGKSVQWVPGFDHAGIATNALFNRLRQQGKIPEGVEMLEWAEKNSGVIRQQLSRLGLSLNWDKEYFTLDKPRTKVVLRAFEALSRKGLISRSRRKVNWSPSLESVVSDSEIELLNITVPKSIQTSRGEISVGKLHFIKFKLVRDKDWNPGASGYEDDVCDYILAATTKLETLFNVVALSVHIKDTRYSKYINDLVWHPLKPNVKLYILSHDREREDAAIGTGVFMISLKGSEFDDYVIHKHKIGIYDKSLISSDGKFKALDELPSYLWNTLAITQRERIVKLLVEAGAYAFSTPVTESIAKCSRTGDIILSRNMWHWMLDMAPLAKNLLDRISGTNFIVGSNGKEQQKLLERALDVKNDGESTKKWCLSRQIKWGHRIPAYLDVKTSKWHISATGERFTARHYTRDSNVLDTWFSSALLPLSVTNPDITFDERGELDACHLNNLHGYPNSLLETGSDILIPWVAKMAMLCLELTGKLPFEKVLLHGMVRDAQGRKMSKSLGNVIDPMHVIEGHSLNDIIKDLREGNLPPEEIERSVQLAKKCFPSGIPACGADALRLTLLEHSQADVLRLDIENLKRYLRICESIHKLAQVILNAQVKDEKKYTSGQYLRKKPLEDWLLFRFRKTWTQYHASFKKYMIGDAMKGLISFIMEDLLGGYISLLKGNRSLDQDKSQNQDKNQNDAEKGSCDFDCLVASEKSSVSWIRYSAQLETLRFVFGGVIMMMQPLAPHLASEIYRMMGEHIQPCKSVPRSLKANVPSSEDSPVVQAVSAIFKIRAQLRRRFEQILENSKSKRDAKKPAVGAKIYIYFKNFDGENGKEIERMIKKAIYIYIPHLQECSLSRNIQILWDTEPPNQGVLPIVPGVWIEFFVKNPKDKNSRKNQDMGMKANEKVGIKDSSGCIPDEEMDHHINIGAGILSPGEKKRILAAIVKLEGELSSTRYRIFVNHLDSLNKGDGKMREELDRRRLKRYEQLLIG